MGGDPVRDHFFRSVLRMLNREKIPFLVGGGYAFSTYTGIARDTKDLDVFLAPEHCSLAMDLARACGYKTYVKSPHWLAKVEAGEWFVDLIYSSGNGACPVDQRWFDNGPHATLLGVKVRLTPPEEMIWSKSFIMERHRYDGADINHIIRAKGDTMDWERLIDRFGEKWLVLLSHLLLYRFVYPAEADRVPDRVLATLIERLPETVRHGRKKEADPLCRGTLLSYLEYLPDVDDWGYRDARLKPGGTMTQREIDRWTAERK